LAIEVRSFDSTIPAGTAKASPLTFNLVFPPRVVRELEIIVPPGPRGEVGFQIGQAGRQVFPTEPGTFFVTDDEQIRWSLEDANTSGAWQLIAYNTGTFNHAIEVRFLVDLPEQLAEAQGFAPISPAEISMPSSLSGPAGGVSLPPPPALPPPPVIPTPALP
jgi:hypothetical protein